MRSSHEMSRAMLMYDSQTEKMNGKKIVVIYYTTGFVRGSSIFALEYT